MTDEKLLATFVAEEIKEKFNIYGNYDVETGYAYSDSGKIEYKYPEFYNITATRITDGKEESYTPTGTTWAGRKYVVNDMIESVISALIMGNTLFTKIYLDNGLQEILDSYMRDDNIAITVNGLKIPKVILGRHLYDLYQLTLVTDTFIYYYSDEDDAMLMLRTEDHSIVSDNYFAEVGYTDSIENVKSGKETLLWGELPKDDDRRLVTLSDGTGMGDRLYIFSTNAPVEELKKLEDESCKVYLEGRSVSEVPIWADVLYDKGYTFEYVTEHQHVSPYGTSSGWLEKNYPDIKENYVIENQPNLK